METPNSIPLKTIHLPSEEGQFHELLFNYEDMAEREEFYVSITCKKEDKIMRRI